MDRTENKNKGFLMKIHISGNKEIKNRSEKIIDIRNRLLSESDWTQLLDVNVNQKAWKKYRQSLRDITKQEGFPFFVQWPEKPLNE